MENNRKTGTGMILLSVVFVIWFIASIVAMIYFSQTNKGALVVTIFGQYFLVFGLIAVISSLKSKKFQAFTLIFPVIGIGAMAGGCIFRFGTEELKKQAEAALPYLFLGLFFIIGVSLVLGTYLTSKRKHEVCNYCITATCVEVKSHYDDGSRTYCPVYEVYFRHETMQICNNFYTNIHRVEVGETREIYLNPEDPNEFYEPKEELSTKRFTYILGGIFVITSVFALVMVMQYVK